MRPVKLMRDLLMENKRARTIKKYLNIDVKTFRIIKNSMYYELSAKIFGPKYKKVK